MRSPELEDHCEQLAGLGHSELNPFLGKFNASLSLNPRPLVRDAGRERTTSRQQGHKSLQPLSARKRMRRRPDDRYHPIAERFQSILVHLPSLRHADICSNRWSLGGPQSVPHNHIFGTNPRVTHNIGRPRFFLRYHYFPSSTAGPGDSPPGRSADTVISSSIALASFLGMYRRNTSSKSSRK